MTKKIAETMCSNINMPECKVLKLNHCFYNASSSNILGIAICSPYTLILYLVSIFLVVRMIRHVNKLYASIGGKEMKLLYYIYISDNLIMAILTCFGEYLNKHLFSGLTSIHLSLISSFYLGVFITSITILRIYGIANISSATFCSIFLLFNFSIIFTFTILGFLTLNYIVPIFIISFNFISIMLFVVYQVRKLKKIDSDIWPYGLLGVIFTLVLTSNSLIFFGGKDIATFCEKNLDNLFFYVLANLIIITMIHKYWSETCDFEIECLTLNA